MDLVVNDYLVNLFAARGTIEAWRAYDDYVSHGVDTEYVLRCLFDVYSSGGANADRQECLAALF